MSTEQPTPLRAKVSQRTINQPQPDMAMPVKIEQQAWQLEKLSSGPSLGTITLLLGVTCVLGFAVFDAVQGIIASFSLSNRVNSCLIT